MSICDPPLGLCTRMDKTRAVLCKRNGCLTSFLPRLQHWPWVRFVGYFFPNLSSEKNPLGTNFRDLSLPYRTDQGGHLGSLGNRDKLVWILGFMTEAAPGCCSKVSVSWLQGPECIQLSLGNKAKDLWELGDTTLPSTTLSRPLAHFSFIKHRPISQGKWEGYFTKRF